MLLILDVYMSRKVKPKNWQQLLECVWRNRIWTILPKMLHKEKLNLKSGNIIPSWLIRIFAVPICQIVSLYGAKNIFQSKKQKIVSLTNFLSSRLWQVLPNATEAFISFQKTTIWQEMTSWCFLMSGINGSENVN